LLKDYNKLWVFGDSYTTPDYCVTPQESFWGLAAKHINADEIVNCSWPGNSLASVWHMLIGMQTEYDFDRDFFIIGIPPLERLTVFDNFKDTKYNATCFDVSTWEKHQQQINCHTGLQIIKGHQAEKMVVYEDRSWSETQALSTLFLITAWLDSVAAKYLIVNLSKPFDSENKWGPSEFVLPYCQNHKRCILFEDTYYSVNVNKHEPADFKKHGWWGHHGPAGNVHFFETSIKDKLC
jgi:hypothetical protein